MAAIEQGFQKGEIERSAYRVALEIDSGERTVVGVNKYTIEAEEKYDPLRVDPTIEAEQRDRLARTARLPRQRRGGRGARAGQGGGAGHRQCPLPHARRAAGPATGGEVADALREVWGQYIPRDAF